MATDILNNKGKKIFTSPSSNLYENTLLKARVAKQIFLKNRVKFEEDLENFSLQSNLNDLIQATSHREQTARKYEQMPGALQVAIKDVEEGNVLYSYPDKNL